MQSLSKDCSASTPLWMKLETNRLKQSRGFCVLEQLTDLQREMKSSQEKNDHKFELLEKEITRLRVNVEGRLMQEEALTIRRRFIDYYKKDVLKLLEYQRTDAIKAGNNYIYSNALSDAYLFKHDNRMDFQTYGLLYGFQFQQVQKYYMKIDDGIDGGIFSVLNAYATLLVQSAEGKETPSELKQAFREFITLAENSYPLTPMDDDNSKLTKVYWDFWRLYKQH